jgi:hypothetical protein
MRRLMVASALLIGPCAVAASAPFQVFPVGDPDLSFLYYVVDIHTARSAGEEVRVFEPGRPQSDGANLAIRVVADKRLPPGTAARIAVWSLPYRVESIEAVSLDDTTIKIDGWLPLGGVSPPARTLSGSRCYFLFLPFFLAFVLPFF